MTGPAGDDACPPGMDESLVDWGRSGAGNPGEGRLGVKGEQAGYGGLREAVALWPPSLEGFLLLK